MQTSSSWGEFKMAVKTKLGLIGQSTTTAAKSNSSDSNTLSFFWEGCEIDEDDDKPLEELAKEGDTFVCCVMESNLTLPGSEDIAALGLPPVDDFFSAGPSGRQANSGNSAPTGKRNASGDHLALLPFGSIEDRGLPSASSQEKKCTCRNSKCIKLYCMCFAGGNLCDGCMCKDCLNAPGNEAFVMSERNKILARNPQAFSLKVEQTGDDTTGHKTGCRCRKSRCVKKYCECFDGGVRCNPNCRCLECANMPYDDPDIEQEPEEVHEPLDIDQGLMSLDGLASLASAAQIASGCIDDGDATKPSLSPGMAAAVAPYHSVAPFFQAGSPGQKRSTEDPHLPEGDRRSPSEDQGNGEGARSTQGESSRGQDLGSGSLYDEESLAALAASLTSVPMPEMTAQTVEQNASSTLLQNALQNHLMALIKGQGVTGTYLSIPLRQAESVSGHSSQQVLPVPPSVQSASPLAPLKTAGAQKEGRASSIIAAGSTSEDQLQ